MDPYYQQQQQPQQQPQPPPLHQSSQQQQRLDMMPSAPQMPVNQSSSQHQQQQLLAQQQGQPIQSHQPSSSHRSTSYNQQHPQHVLAAQQSGYGPETSGLASQYPGQLSAGSGGHSRQLNGSGGGGHTSSSHHHGGGQQTTHNQPSGHHSSSRYQGGGGGSTGHRSAMMHQHRTSAAAISDPMMASTITDSLASASGPITGSGSALNQLGYLGPVGGGPNYYSGQRDDPSGAMYDQQMLSGQQANYGPVSHQSRYDTHYNPRNVSGRHTSAGLGASTTTAGAYHLDRNDLNIMANDPMMRPGLDRRNYPGAMHQSLGNLPSATNSRLNAIEQQQQQQQQQQQRAYALDSGLGVSSHQHSGVTGQERYFGGGLEGRSGSMPRGVEGLGIYNPLDDPLATHQLHSRGYQLGPDMQFSGTSGPSYGANPHIGPNTGNRDVYVTELRARLQEAQNNYVGVKRELETATQKLGSSMHSIKSFWSPELKKERALRKEEATKYALINDQMKLMRVEVQKQALLIRQLEDELRLAHDTRLRTTDPDIQQHIDALCMEKEGLFRENCSLRETVCELEMRIETQKQTLAARDDSIKKMVEMLNNKGIATKIMEDERIEMDRIKTRNIELEARLRHYDTINEAKEKEIIKATQPKQILASSYPDLQNPACQFSSIIQKPTPKSPVPKQRKLTTSGSKPSKAERIKSRLTNGSGNSSKQCPPPSKEKVNEMMIQSWSSGSSSSGFCSSKELSSQSKKVEPNNEVELTSEIMNQKMEPNTNGKIESVVVVENSNNTSNNYKFAQSDFKVCDCHECRANGQQIANSLMAMNNSKIQQSNYGNIQAILNKQQSSTIASKRPPTPPRLARKAVSFRSSVEHIGSPNNRKLRDASASASATASSLKSLFQPPFYVQPIRTDDDDNDSCDSMHVTKDFSLVNNPHDDDYLLPRDCSTPKGNPENGEQLVQVEVHKPKIVAHQQQEGLIANERKIQDYTCLCSADFICAHNYAPVSDQRSVATSSDLRFRAIPRHQDNSQDLILSKDCNDCNNLSTYVNLSRQMEEPNGQPSNYNNFNSSNNLSVAGSSSIDGNGSGYKSNEYKQLIKKKQNEVYGVQNNIQKRQTQNWSATNERREATTSNQENDYLTAMRRFQLSIEDCEICHRQLVQQSSSDMMQCSCLPLDNEIMANKGAGRGGPTERREAEAGDISLQLRNSSSSTTKSFHTASSSLNNNLIPTLTQNQNQQQMYINSSELSVLPLNASTSSRQQPDYMELRRLHLKQTGEKHETKLDSRFEIHNNEGSSNGNNNNIDSSLSSLFVYRHASDNNTPDMNEGFDPDSLEIIKPSNCLLNDKDNDKNNSNNTRIVKASNNNSWLESKQTKSEYIPLSSTNSTISTTATAKPKANKQQTTTTGNYLTANRASKVTNEGCQMMQLGTDITQSSLAKRRHLANSLQQQNGKKKLLLNKSKTLPNVSQHNRSSSSSSSNVRNIYQCVKNHLFDLKKSNSGSTKQLNGHQVESQQTGTGNNSSNSNSNSTATTATESSSATLPSNFGSSTKSGRPLNKLVQMEELRGELTKRDQELLTVNAKMKALEDQQRDSQRHIRLLKDSLVAKEEHYNLLLADVEELRRNLNERNKLIEKKSFQQTMSGSNLRSYGESGILLKSSQQQQQQQQQQQHQFNANYQELQEMQNMLEIRDKKINDLQRKVVQLDNILGERDAQLDRTRMRLERSMVTGSNHPDIGSFNHLEETLCDKERQISLLRDQRDRAERELNEERDSHERSIKEYKMKLNSVKFEMEKVQNRLSKDGCKYGANDLISSANSGDRFGLNSDQGSIIKRLELDKRSLQLECDRLKDKLDTLNRSSSTTNRAARLTGERSIDRASSALGDYSVVEFERLQESLESQKQELRRAQAEGRMNEMERKRAQEEADKLSERYERCQSEMHKLKAKLENAISEREQLVEEYERQQQMINKAQTERDCALADINQLKLDSERQLANFNKNQLQVEKVQAQLERAQLEYKKLEDKFNEASDELRHLQNEKLNTQRELKRLEMELETSQIQQQRLQQEKELTRNDVEKIRDKYDHLESEMERYLHDKELNNQQVIMYKERIENHQQQISKLIKEREQMSIEIHELRDRLHKQQKLQDQGEHETRNEVRIWKEKYERLTSQFEKLNQDMLSKQKETQMIMEKLQRIQSEAVKLETKLEQSEMDRERLVIEVEKSQQLSNKAKEDFKKWQDELQQLQEMYTKTNTKLLKLIEVEEKLRIDYDKCQMDLEVLRERYEKLQLESRKLQAERDRLHVEHERIRFDNERIQQSQGSQQTNQDDLIRVSGELERTLAKLDQYQREINKLQLEKERLLLDSKSTMQQTEQQFQQQLLKIKTNEEKALMELERTRIQLDKVQSKHEQVNVDQEKLVSDKERLQQQLLLLQQEVDKFRNQQSSSVQETKKLHDDEMQRVLQELETIREKYTQQRKELLQLRELQQNHDIDKDILRRELQSAESRLEKFNQSDSKQKQDSERCMIEIEKMKDILERKQQELVRTQKERNQFAQEITVLHQQIQQLQIQFEQHQKQSPAQGQAQGQPGSQQQQQQQVKADEINKLKQMLVKSENELQKTMAENQRFQMEVERLKLQLDDAAEYIGKIESDNKMLQKQSQEIIGQLKQQQQQLAGQNQQQQQQSQSSQQSQQEVERAQQEMRKMQDVIKKSAHEIQKMVEERNKVQEVNKELQRNLEQTKIDFQATMEQYEAELQKLQQEAQLQRQQQQQSSNQQAASSATNDEYKVKFEKAVEAIRAFQKTSDDMKKEIIKLNERNKSLGEQNQNLTTALKSLEENLQRVQKQQQSSEKQQDANSQGLDEQVKQQLENLTELCGKLEKDLGKSREETQQHSQANQQLKQALDKSKSEMSNLKTERDRFQSQLEKLMVELERREDEMANLQTQQDKSGQNLQAKQNELISYQKQLEEREIALEKKREELQNLSKQIQQQQPQQQGNQQQQQQQQLEMIAKLQQQVKVLEDEKVKLKGELERVRNELKQAQTELERLLKILSATEEDKFSLTQQIDQLQAKLKSMPAQPGATGATGGQQGPQQQQQQHQTQQARGAQQAPSQQQHPQQPQPQPQQPQQQQRPPQQAPPPRGQQQQQQKPATQNQRPSGAGGFISGFFQ